MVRPGWGREAAGVLAAAVAEAMRPGATADSVVATCLRLARDGTAAAIDAVCSAARDLGHWDGSFETLRAAMKPYDTVADTYRDQGLGARRPSRQHSIEELPLALAFLLIAKGGYRDTVLGGVNYGRDADSTPVSEICTTGIQAVEPDVSVDDVLRIMREEDIRRLPVVKNGRPVGIVSLGDLAVEREPGSTLADISAATPDQ